MRRPRRCTSARQNTVDRFVGAERERRMSETVDPREGGQGGEFMREVIRKRSTAGESCWVRAFESYNLQGH